MPLADGQVVAGYTIPRMAGPAGWASLSGPAPPGCPATTLKVLGAAVSKDEEYRQRFNLGG